MPSPHATRTLLLTTPTTTMSPQISHHLSQSVTNELQPPVLFSFRLRHEAIKQGYRLITSEDTAPATLSRGFRFCMFNSTREEITEHLRHLLEESSKLMDRNEVKDVHTCLQNCSQDASPTNFTESHVTRSWVDEPSSAVDCCTEELESNIKDGMMEYIDADTVQKYLAEKGLPFQSGASFVTLSEDSAFKSSKTGTLFEQILGNRALILDIAILIRGKKAFEICNKMKANIK